MLVARPCGGGVGRRRRGRAATAPSAGSRRGAGRGAEAVAPGAVPAQGQHVPIEISEYAGYAGLIAANGGLEPTENSVFFKQHGFKVKLTVSEDENWSELNEGKIAASVTTVDVLAVYGRQFHAVVPAQIGFSRGADGLVVRSDIKRINELKGKVDRHGAVHRGRLLHPLPRAGSRPGVSALGSLDATPNPERINLVYTEDGFGAGDLFLSELKSGQEPPRRLP